MILGNAEDSHLLYQATRLDAGMPCSIWFYAPTEPVAAATATACLCAKCAQTKETRVTRPTNTFTKPETSPVVIPETPARVKSALRNPTVFAIVTC